MYDYLVVGAGLYGATFAQQMREHGRSVLVLEKRDHLAGTAHTALCEGILVHAYGPHIFHTNSAEAWAYVNRFAHFEPFINTPIANYHGKLYNMPFNMNTFYQLWGVTTPEEAMAKIASQREDNGGREPRNLEEKAIASVGRDIYHTLIQGYTEKQWGRDCRQLPPWIISRLPLRFTFNNNYFNAAWQGIPREGYTQMVSAMLEGVEVRLNTDYLAQRDYWNGMARRVLFTGTLDAYWDYCFGPLAYRGCRFDTKVLDQESFQGNAVVNYTDRETPWTRIIEHKWLRGYPSSQAERTPKTVISYEYSQETGAGGEPFYPINDESNNRLFGQYEALSQAEPGRLFGGRMAEYRYYDMDQVILKALQKAREALAQEEASGLV